MYDSQTLEGSTTVNSLFKTFGIIECLCFELVVAFHFLLSLLLSPSCLIYLATVKRDTTLPDAFNSTVTLGLP